MTRQAEQKKEKETRWRLFENSGICSCNVVDNVTTLEKTALSTNSWSDFVGAVHSEYICLTSQTNMASKFGGYAIARPTMATMLKFTWVEQEMFLKLHLPAELLEI